MARSSLLVVGMGFIVTFGCGDASPTGQKLSTPPIPPAGRAMEAEGKGHLPPRSGDKAKPKDKEKDVGKK